MNDDRHEWTIRIDGEGIILGVYGSRMASIAYNHIIYSTLSPHLILLITHLSQPEDESNRPNPQTQAPLPKSRSVLPHRPAAPIHDLMHSNHTRPIPTAIPPESTPVPRARVCICPAQLSSARPRPSPSRSLINSAPVRDSGHGYLRGDRS